VEGARRQVAGGGGRTGGTFAANPQPGHGHHKKGPTLPHEPRTRPASRPDRRHRFTRAPRSYSLTATACGWPSRFNREGKGIGYILVPERQFRHADTTRQGVAMRTTTPPAGRGRTAARRRRFAAAPPTTPFRDGCRPLPCLASPSAA
jgi:hypothetical protein